jgi:hypothetical protein
MAKAMKAASRSKPLSKAEGEILKEAEVKASTAKGAAKAAKQLGDELARQSPGRGHRNKSDKAVPVGRNFTNLGKEDAERLASAAGAYGATRAEVVQHFKTMNPDEFKTYIKGIRVYREALDDSRADQAATLRGAESEFKRIFNSYQVKGIEWTDAVLNGTAPELKDVKNKSFREKMKVLPLVSKGGQGKGRKGKRKSTGAEDAKVTTFESVDELMKEIEQKKPDQKKGAQPPLGELSEDAIRNVVIYGMTDRLIPRLFANLLAKCKMSKDPFWNEMSRELQKTWDAKIKASGKEDDVRQAATRKAA